MHVVTPNIVLFCKIARTHFVNNSLIYLFLATYDQNNPQFVILVEEFDVRAIVGSGGTGIPPAAQRTSGTGRKGRRRRLRRRLQELECFRPVLCVVGGMPGSKRRNPVRVRIWNTTELSNLLRICQNIFNFNIDIPAIPEISNLPGKSKKTA